MLCDRDLVKISAAAIDRVAGACDDFLVVKINVTQFLALVSGNRNHEMCLSGFGGSVRD